MVACIYIQHPTEQDSCYHFKMRNRRKANKDQMEVRLKPSREIPNPAILYLNLRIMKASYGFQFCDLQHTKPSMVWISHHSYCFPGPQKLQHSGNLGEAQLSSSQNDLSRPPSRDYYLVIQLLASPVWSIHAKLHYLLILTMYICTVSTLQIMYLCSPNSSIPSLVVSHHNYSGLNKLFFF